MEVHLNKLLFCLEPQIPVSPSLATLPNFRNSVSSFLVFSTHLLGSPFPAQLCFMDHRLTHPPIPGYLGLVMSQVPSLPGHYIMLVASTGSLLCLLWVESCPQKRYVQGSAPVPMNVTYLETGSLHMQLS